MTVQGCSISLFYSAIFTIIDSISRAETRDPSNWCSSWWLKLSSSVAKVGDGSCITVSGSCVATFIIHLFVWYLHNLRWKHQAFSFVHGVAMWLMTSEDILILLCIVLLMMCSFSLEAYGLMILLCSTLEDSLVFESSLLSWYCLMFSSCALVCFKGFLTSLSFFWS